MVRKIIYCLVLVVFVIGGSVFLSAEKDSYKQSNKKLDGVEEFISSGLSLLPETEMLEVQGEQISSREGPLSYSSVSLVKRVEKSPVIKKKIMGDGSSDLKLHTVVLPKENQDYQYPDLPENRVVQNAFLGVIKSFDSEVSFEERQFISEPLESSFVSNNLVDVPQVFSSNVISNNQLPLISIQNPVPAVSVDTAVQIVEKLAVEPKSGGLNVVDSVVKEVGDIDVVKEHVEEVDVPIEDFQVLGSAVKESEQAVVIGPEVEGGQVVEFVESGVELEIVEDLIEGFQIVKPVDDDVAEVEVAEDSVEDLVGAGVSVEKQEIVESLFEEVGKVVAKSVVVEPEDEEVPIISPVVEAVVDDVAEVEVAEDSVEDLVGAGVSVEKQEIVESLFEEVGKVVEEPVVVEPEDEEVPIVSPVVEAVVDDVAEVEVVEKSVEGLVVAGFSTDKPEIIESSIGEVKSVVEESKIEEISQIDISEEIAVNEEVRKEAEKQLTEEVVVAEIPVAESEVSVQAVELRVASALPEQPQIIIEPVVEEEVVEDIVVDEVSGVGSVFVSIGQSRSLEEAEKAGLISILSADSVSEKSLINKNKDDSISPKNNMSVGLAGVNVGLSVEDPLAPTMLSADSASSYEKGKFIVKFKSHGKHALNQCAHCLLAKRTLFQLAVADGSDSLDQLNKDCGVTGAKSIFVQRHGITTKEAMIEEDLKYSLIKSKFSKRTSRITKDAEIPDLTNFYVMDVPKHTDVDAICELYSNDPHVEFAQPVHMMKIEAFPTDPPNDTFYASNQWGMNNTGQTGGTADADIDAPEAWAKNLGDNIVVAVNDTGVDYNHEDLVANMWSNTDETSNGLDSDGNGYIDDIRGWDFYDNDNDPIYDSPESTTWHGTHVAGTVAAVGNNGKGVIGVAPNAKIMAIKGFGLSGVDLVGSSSTLAPGIVYAAQNGADVINNSWGCSSACPSDPTVEAAVLTAYGLGTVVVFSAGNDDVDVVNYSPQNMTEPVVVASSDQDDLNSSFSSFGATVDVIAPGSDIASTYPTNQYASASGTSMASPHTAGLAALILSENSSLNLTNAQVEAVLQDTSDSYNKIAADAANDYGDGRINAYNAVRLNNLIPVMSAGVDRSVDFGDLLQFTVSASDPRNDSLTLTAVLSDSSAVTTIGATFTDNGDRTGQFSWTPTLSQVGLNPDISFIATDPDSFSHTDTMTITVNTGYVCGNGSIDPGEQCDDSNTTACDGCSATCQTEACGNGTQECLEGCDDGNTTSGDGCTDMCVAEFCGDGVLNNNGTEQCDDSNTVSGDGCSSVCVTEFCGDGVVNNNGTEGCDDGNTTSGDGCTSMCVDEFCGDGIVNDGGTEQCDDNNTVSEDGCSNQCVTEFCGDGIWQAGLGEECDDGNASSTDGCSTSCIIVSVCGDLVCEMGENCSSCWQDCGRCRGGLRPRR